MQELLDRINMYFAVAPMAGLVIPAVLWLHPSQNLDKYLDRRGAASVTKRSCAGLFLVLTQQSKLNRWCVCVSVCVGDGQPAIKLATNKGPSVSDVCLVKCCCLPELTDVPKLF